MTFGYLGYIWAMLGCSLFGAVVGGSALFLYGIARRAEKRGSAPRVVVEDLSKPSPSKPPSDAA